MSKPDLNFLLSLDNVCGSNLNFTCFHLSLAERVRKTPELQINDEDALNEILLKHCPELVKPLLTEFIANTMSERQMLGAANLFHQLSFDVPITAIVPRSLSGLLMEMFLCGHREDLEGLRREIEKSFAVSKHLGMASLTQVDYPIHL